MEILNSESLCNVFMHCNNNSKYMAIIVFRQLNDASECVRALCETHKSEKIPGVDSFVIGRLCTSKINFKNGSRIEFITVGETTRGRRCNEILYNIDVDIEDTDTRCSLQQMLVPYRYGLYNENSGKSEEVATNAEFHDETLDEFLKSFLVEE